MRYFGTNNEILSFLVRFAAWTAVLGFLWQTGLHEYYLEFLKPIAFAFLKIVGAKKWLYSRVADQFVNLVPYASLVLASPGLLRRWPKTLLAGIGGIVLLMAEHLLLSWAVYGVEQAYSESMTRELFVIPMWIVSAALPFVLWLSFYPDVVAPMMARREVR